MSFGDRRVNVHGSSLASLVIECIWLHIGGCVHKEVAVFATPLLLGFRGRGERISHSFQNQMQFHKQL
jgi:hypothetical protein